MHKLKIMDNYPKLNFPPCRLRARETGGRTRVWDDCRRLWVVLTPEEWVRRHLVSLLTDRMGIERARVKLEYPVDVNGMCQRADVLVVDNEGKPLLLAECKAPEISIDEAVYAQAVRYNTYVGARYVMLTNGVKHYIYEADGNGGYTSLDSLPPL